MNHIENLKKKRNPKPRLLISKDTGSLGTLWLHGAPEPRAGWASGKR